MKKFSSVIVIDDDPASAFVCEKILKFLSFADDLKFFINGEEALNYLNRQKRNSEIKHPTLILLDLDMPVMNGFTFIKELNKLPIDQQEVEIAVLATTSAFSEKVKTAKSLGIKYYIAKPLDVNKMKELQKYMELGKREEFTFFN